MTRPAQEVILEVAREGRRPRYHRGARLDGGEGQLVKPEQCNLDQVAATIRELDALDFETLPRPWTQLCRRCFAGSFLLLVADERRAAYLRDRGR